jgi:hypothetical protein
MDSRSYRASQVEVFGQGLDDLTHNIIHTAQGLRTNTLVAQPYQKAQLSNYSCIATYIHIQEYIFHY